MFERTSGATVVAIVTAVAEKEGTDPTELTPPLTEVLDMEALDRLLDSAGSRQQMTVQFSYRGHTVAVDADGQVEVT